MLSAFQEWAADYFWFLTMYDWHIFRVAGLELLQGGNPYSTGEGLLRFYNPWWTLVILAPLVVLPEALGKIANVLISFLIYIPVTRRYGIDKWGYFLIVTSAFHIRHIITGNIDWIVWIGLFLPAPIALLFFAIKPQMGVGLIIFTLYTAYRKHGIARAGLYLLPLVALTAIGLLWFGLPSYSPVAGNNVSILPFGLPMGLGLIYLSLTRCSERESAQAAPLFAPYLSYHSYIGLLFTPSTKGILTFWIITYIPFVIRVCYETFIGEWG